jgi:AcrR family transcriptional regulator
MRLLPGHASRVPLGTEPIRSSDTERDQRRRILRATAELVAKRGYHATTVEHIVKNARVGHATFYKHFETKEDCFLALLDQVAAQTTHRMNEASSTAEGPWPEQVAAALQALFAMVVDQPLVARACLVESLTAGPTAVAHYERALSRVGPLLLQGRQYLRSDCELPATLEDTLAHAVVWMVYQRLIAGEADQITGLLPEALEFILRPYLGEDEAAQHARRLQTRGDGM